MQIRPRFNLVKRLIFETPPEWHLCLSSLLKVNSKNFWQADLSRTTVVIIYGFSALLARLEIKLK